MTQIQIRTAADFVKAAKKRMAEKSMTQGQLAQKLDVSVQRVSQLLSEDNTNLELSTMLRIAKAVGMTLHMGWQ